MIDPRQCTWWWSTHLIEALVGGLADGGGEARVHGSHVGGRHGVGGGEAGRDAAERVTKVGNEVINQIAGGRRVAAKVDGAGVVLTVEPGLRDGVGVERVKRGHHGDVHELDLVGQRVGAEEDRGVPEHLLGRPAIWRVK